MLSYDNRLSLSLHSRYLVMQDLNRRRIKICCWLIKNKDIWFGAVDRSEHEALFLSAAHRIHIAIEQSLRFECNYCPSDSSFDLINRDAA
ncbi:hypothetical protein EGYY_15520 [Eggerthella sp. YY7918]|nr:hypothetical protein EGYY_15520 [Eggerthella sp. YY7918]